MSSTDDMITRRGTGFGACNHVLSRTGQCANAGNHVIAKQLIINGNSLGESLILTPSSKFPGSLEVTADLDTEETTVVLHPEAVRRLRLALQKFEKHGDFKS